MEVKRGDVSLGDLNPVVGTEINCREDIIHHGTR